MNDLVKILVYGLGIALFLEGIPYLTFPKKAKEVAVVISEMSDEALRIIGGALVMVGFILLYFV